MDLGAMTMGLHLFICVALSSRAEYAHVAGACFSFSLHVDRWSNFVASLTGHQWPVKQDSAKNKSHTVWSCSTLKLISWRSIKYLFFCHHVNCETFKKGNSIWIKQTIILFLYPILALQSAYQHMLAGFSLLISPAFSYVPKNQNMDNSHTHSNSLSLQL